MVIIAILINFQCKFFNFEIFGNAIRTILSIPRRLKITVLTELDNPNIRGQRKVKKRKDKSFC